MVSGLSPKRTADPPLDYDRAYRQEDFSDLVIAVNGGITTLEQTKEHLQHLDGVMIGHEAYHNPFILAEVDQQIFGLDTPIKKRSQVVEEMYPYIERELSNGANLGI